MSSRNCRTYLATLYAGVASTALIVAAGPAFAGGVNVTVGGHTIVSIGGGGGLGGVGGGIGGAVGGAVGSVGGSVGGVSSGLGGISSGGSTGFFSGGVGSGSAGGGGSNFFSGGAHFGPAQHVFRTGRQRETRHRLRSNNLPRDTETTRWQNIALCISRSFRIGSNGRLIPALLKPIS